MKDKTSHKPTLLGVGHPLLDISVDVTKQFLQSFGLKPNDGILGQPHHEPIVTQLFDTDQFKMRTLAGGCVLNSVRYAQWVFNGSKDAAGQTVFLGSVGDDAYADLLLEQTTRDGVKPVFVKIVEPLLGDRKPLDKIDQEHSSQSEDQITSKVEKGEKAVQRHENVKEDERQAEDKENGVTATVGVNDNKPAITKDSDREHMQDKPISLNTKSNDGNRGESPVQPISYSYENSHQQTGVCVALNTENGRNRSMLAFLGAARALNAEHVQQQSEHAQMADTVYSSGFLLASSADAVWELIRLRRPDQLFAFNLSAEYVCHAHGERLWQLLPHVDLLFCNGEELAAFAKFNKWQENDVKTIARKLLEMVDRKSISNQSNEKRRSLQLIITRERNPVLVFERQSTPDGIAFLIPTLSDDQLVDTVGAGDAFVGGFLAKRLLNKSLDECVQTGIFCARQAITVSGCQLKGTFDQEQVRKLFTKRIDE